MPPRKPIQTPGAASQGESFDLADADQALQPAGTLPEDEAPNAQELMLELASVRAEIAKLKAAQPQHGPDNKPGRLMTQVEAAGIAGEMVAQGHKPRAILTVDGWYTHPEMARTAVHGAKG